MSTEAKATCEEGGLRLSTPVPLPKHSRVRVQILNEEKPVDELCRAEAALIAAGLMKPTSPTSVLRAVFQRATNSRLVSTHLGTAVRGDHRAACRTMMPCYLDTRAHT